MQTLNEIVDQIYCINLDKRTDRWDETVSLFSHMNISAKRVSGIEDPERPWNGLRKTVIGIFKEAIDLDYEKIIIFEDDIDVDKSKFYNDLEICMSHLPEDWDMFYFSAAHQQWPVAINGFLFKLSWSTAAHAIMFRKKAFVAILKELEKLENDAIDVTYSILQPKLNAYCCINPIAWQRKSFSDIEMQEKWYPYLKDIDFYNKYRNGMITIDGKEIEPPSSEIQ
jgi:hypothetical protein